jgi:hypothetical protein
MVEQIGKIRAPAYALRLEDILDAKIYAKCLCRHEGPVDLKELLRRHTPAERLVLIEPKLRCRACGLRAASRFKVVYPD